MCVNMKKHAIGIDIGGTNTRVALVDEDLQIIKRIQFPTIVANPHENILQIKKSIQAFQTKIEGVGVSCPGPLDLRNGEILTPPNLEKWHNFKIVKEMEEVLNLPVYLENDANLACLAEAVIGAGKQVEIVQFLTISTGVGAGLCIHKQIYRGAHGNAHEIANMIMWKDGPYQGSLKKGSIESISSGSAIVKRAHECNLHVQHAGEVNDLAKQGNLEAKAIMDDAYEYLANAIATMFALLDPHIIILSGSVALKIDGFMNHVEELVKQKVYPNMAKYVHLETSQLDEDCGLIGAAYLVFTK